MFTPEVKYPYGMNLNDHATKLFDKFNPKSNTKLLLDRHLDRRSQSRKET